MLDEWKWARRDVADRVTKVWGCSSVRVGVASGRHTRDLVFR